MRPVAPLTAAQPRRMIAAADSEVAPFLGTPLGASRLAVRLLEPLDGRLRYTLTAAPPRRTIAAGGPHAFGDEARVRARRTSRLVAAEEVDHAYIRDLGSLERSGH